MNKMDELWNDATSNNTKCGYHHLYLLHYLDDKCKQSLVLGALNWIH